jgi:hypothetical protein
LVKRKFQLNPGNYCEVVPFDFIYCVINLICSVELHADQSSALQPRASKLRAAEITEQATKRAYNKSLNPPKSPKSPKSPRTPSEAGKVGRDTEEPSDQSSLPQISDEISSTEAPVVTVEPDINSMVLSPAVILDVLSQISVRPLTGVEMQMIQLFRKWSPVNELETILSAMEAKQEELNKRCDLLCLHLPIVSDSMFAYQIPQSN